MKEKIEKVQSVLQIIANDQTNPEGSVHGETTSNALELIIEYLDVFKTRDV